MFRLFLWLLNVVYLFLVFSTIWGLGTAAKSCVDPLEFTAD